jgi:hypothetical protein
MVDSHQVQETIRLGDLNREFLIPDYQRGYRWTHTQVNDLLKDVQSFHDLLVEQGKDDLIYFLHPLVVCGSDSDPKSNAICNVIDGQQRLITVYLIDCVLCYLLNKGRTLHFNLTFNTRDDSTGELLRNIAIDPEKSFDEFLSKKNIDCFHIVSAKDIIINTYKPCCETEKEKLEKIKLLLGENIHVLWDFKEDSGDSASHFTRLNSGRIALSGAELTRALLLSPTYCQKESPVILGSQWDNIERGLRDPDFWAFIGGKPDVLSTRIDFLLDLYAGKKVFYSQYSDNYFAFLKIVEKLIDNGKKVDSFVIWDEITLYYQKISEWFRNNDYYHWIGYLIREKGDNLSYIQEILNGSKGMKKSEFAEYLKNEIIKLVNIDNISDIDNLEYEKNNNEILKILFLVNIEYIRQSKTDKTDNNYFRRFPFRLHDKYGWTLEHIEAQNSEKLNTRNQWESWAKDHKNALELLNNSYFCDDSWKPKIKELIGLCSDFITNKSSGMKLFDNLYKKVKDFIEYINDVNSLHNISNLALLDGKNNAVLSNSMYFVKKNKLLEKIRDFEYIPPLTEATFMRYFTKEDKGLPYWSSDDRKDYLNQIEKILSFYYPDLDKS